VNKVKVAVIGAGRQAKRAHYPALAAMDDVELAGICDLDDERLNTTADRYAIGQRYHDYRKMLAEVQPDAVYVIMEVHLLYDIVYHALTNGCHVFIEKPPFLTQFQAESMAQIAEKAGRLTMVGFERRFAPLMVETRKLVEAEAPIVQARAAVFKDHVGMESPYHRGTIDFLTTDGIHCVDWLRWACGGEVKQVVSKVRKLYATYDNTYTALIEFDNGAIGELSTSWAMGSRQWLFELHARGVSAYINATGPDDQASIYAGERVSIDWQWRKEGEAFKKSMAEAANSSDHHLCQGFYAENRHFIDCIKTGKQPQTNFADGVKTMELIERIYHSQI
jgi:predicted dehydrogenase